MTKKRNKVSNKLITTLAMLGVIIFVFGMLTESFVISSSKVSIEEFETLKMKVKTLEHKNDFYIETDNLAYNKFWGAYPEAKEIPVRTIVDMLLDHLNLKLKWIPEKDAKIILEEK